MAFDEVTRPSHYCGETGGIEPFDFIESQKLDFAQGNIVKYVVRYRRKGNAQDGVKDLEKAAWYLSRLIRAEKNAR